MIRGILDAIAGVVRIAGSAERHDASPLLCWTTTSINPLPMCSRLHRCVRH
jgi:hypothetical protein